MLVFIGVLLALVFWPFTCLILSLLLGYITLKIILLAALITVGGLGWLSIQGVSHGLHFLSANPWFVSGMIVLSPVIMILIGIYMAYRPNLGIWDRISKFEFFPGDKNGQKQTDYQ